MNIGFALRFPVSLLAKFWDEPLCTVQAQQFHTETIAWHGREELHSPKKAKFEFSGFLLGRSEVQHRAQLRGQRVQREWLLKKNRLGG
jgi:hypothetical protein